MPRSKKDAIPHGCENCRQPTTRPRFCCNACVAAFYRDHGDYGAPEAVALGYCHMGTDITPVPEATKQKAAALREHQRREREAEAARQRIAIRQRAEISKECTPGEMRNDRDYFPTPEPRNHAAPRCASCGYRPSLEGERFCSQCRGKEKRN